MNALTTHNYNGFAISQDFDGYSSLTDMARACGKLVGHYLALDSTNEFLQVLSDDIDKPISSLVKVFKGGNGKQGTWAHPEVAIDFAQWCNVAFRIWANRTLRGVIENQQLNMFEPDLSIRNLELQLEIARETVRGKEIDLETLKIERGLTVAPQPFTAIPQRTTILSKKPITAKDGTVDLNKIVERFRGQVITARHLIRIRACKTAYEGEQILHKLAELGLGMLGQTQKSKPQLEIAAL